MIVRNLWLVLLLSSTFLAITVTSVANRSDDSNLEVYERKKLFHVKLNKSNGYFLASEKYQPKDVQSKKKSWIKVIESEASADGSRLKRNATVLDEYKGAKKSHKKLKLTRTDYKGWKNKANGETTKIRRHVSTNTYNLTDKSDYYALRKAVMDRYYARQKQIAEKYAKKVSTTPKYNINYESSTSTSTTSHRFDNNTTTIVLTTMTPRRVIETTTINPSRVQTVGNSTETNDDVYESGEYDYYGSDAAVNHGSLNDGQTLVDDNKSDVLKWGTCEGKIVYQHNLSLNVRKAMMVEADLTAFLEGPFCVSCIRVTPTNNVKANLSLDYDRKQDGTFRYVKIHVKSSEDEEIAFIVKIWAVAKSTDRCDDV